MGGFLVPLLLALSCRPAVSAEAPAYRPDPGWPQPLPHGWVLGQVSGVSVDRDDTVWIIQRPVKGPHAAPPVIAFTPAGVVMASWGGPGKGYDWPESEHGIRVDPTGAVWIGGNGGSDGQVLKFTRDGRFLLQIGHPAHGAASNDTSRLGRPADVAVDPAAHEVYIADGYANRRVIVFDSETGAYKRHWGAYGTRPEDRPQHYDPRGPLPRQFGTPVHCVKLARDGLVYICDRQNDRIQVFGRDGHFVTEFRVAPETLGMGTVWDLALSVDPAQALLFDADGQNERVHILDRADGTVRGGFGSSGRAPGQFLWVHNIAVDSHGTVFTTEVGEGRRVQRFVPIAPR
ncbi:MAG: hypothetical protein JSS43_33385 [Proteobacteria bacterium]|nr:hypothetical protein [Pseudomonadota bacterium]